MHAKVTEAHASQTMTEKQITDIVVSVLRGQSEAEWKRYTHDHGPYDITRLNHNTERICRAIERAILSASAAPTQPDSTARDADFMAPTSEHDDDDLCATCGNTWGQHFGRCCDVNQSPRRFTLSASAAQPGVMQHTLCGKCMTPHICAEDGPGCAPASDLSAVPTKE